MSRKHDISFSRLLAQILFLALPTILAVTFLLWDANNFFSILREQWMQQSIYFSIGIIVSLIFYQFRFRFLSTFIVLVLLFVLGYKFLDNFAMGEFDSFFISKQFLVFALLFSLGWICGWGLERFRSFAIVLAATIFMFGVYLISKTGEIKFDLVLYSLIPLILFAFYIIFASNELHNAKESGSLSYGHLLKRMTIFLLIFGLTSSAIVYATYENVKAKFANYGGGDGEEGNAVLNQKEDGSVSSSESMQPANGNKRSNDLVFCAHIDNYFENSNVPNPLYLTSFSYGKFDTITETFERDSLMPFNDEFTPDPSSIPLFSVQNDPEALKNALSNRGRKEIEIVLYKKKLSADAFLAPSTAFSIQPITVEKDYQSEFKSAYKSKSYISSLNSAYFVYNSQDPYLEVFQEQRYAQLRNAPSYKNMDASFMEYYTHFPTNSKFQKFKQLGDSLGANKNKTIDKVLAIKDYFTTKTSSGTATFSYTDNPGIPGLPGASKLSTFMFETKKGYCAYYAGASLLLLRAMNIPSRISVGFMTVDRSDNNKGWYWFYEDQAHAWVQVYFPEYGWLDFDTTVGDEEARNSPGPDGTPPLQPPKPIIALSGSALQVDTLKNNLDIKAEHFLFRKKEFPKLNRTVRLDLNEASIWIDTVRGQLSDIQSSDRIMAVSYDEGLRARGNDVDAILSNLPKPLAVDEVYLVKKPEIDEAATVETKEKGSLRDYLWSFLAILCGFVLFLFSLPRLSYWIYRLKAKKVGKKQAYYTYKATNFYLHQMGIEQNKLTLLEFARDVVDPNFKAGYSKFAKTYLKLKYAGQKLSQSEQEFVSAYFSKFESKVQQGIPSKERIKKFLNLNNYFTYYLKPKAV